MFVQHALASPTGSVTKGRVQSFRTMTIEILPKETRVPRPGNDCKRPIVSEKRAKSTGELYFTSRNSPRSRKSCTLAASGEIPVGIFRSGALHASDRPTGRETYFPPKRHVPPGYALYFQERLRKAKEQEEVIHARHCYPTLGTLDRNRTWKPTRLAPLAFSSSSSRPARARFCRRCSAAIPAIDTPHCSRPRTAIISSFLTADPLLP